MGYCSQNVSDARVALGAVLENLGGNGRVDRNRGAFDYMQVPDFYEKLVRKGSVVARQFAFALLTASRLKPVRMMTWDQIDFEKRTWMCPEESMKVKGRGGFRRLFQRRSNCHLAIDATTSGHRVCLCESVWEALFRCGNACAHFAVQRGRC